MKLDTFIASTPVEVSSTHAGFLAYARRFLGAFETSDNGQMPELQVSIATSPADKGGHRPGHQWGSEVLQQGDHLGLCAHAGAGVYCDITEGEASNPPRIVCYARLSPARRLWRLLRGKRAAENQLFMTLIRQGILLPALARQLAKQNLLTLHASVVALNGRAIVLTGLNGCGKSGLAFHLVTRHQFAFLADNFAVLNPESRLAHAFPEPIRVGDRERAQAEGFFAGTDRAFGKWQLAPLPSVLRPQASVACLARIHIGEKFAVRKFEAAPFADHLDSLHRFLGETPEYSWTQLYYQMRHSIHLGQLADAARRKLSASVPCYELEIPRAATSEARYQEATQWIIQALSNPHLGVR